jgi:hypothetical protein
MAMNSIEDISKILEDISVSASAETDLSGNEGGCYNLSSKQVSISDLQAVTWLSDDQSDKLWSALEDKGTTLSAIARLL